MKKLSLAIILLSSLHTASGYNAAYAAGKTSHSQAEEEGCSLSSRVARASEEREGEGEKRRQEKRLVLLFIF